jgi:hypothetical protein
MPPWLTAGNPTLYFLLGSAAVIGAVQWWRTRQRKYAVATGIALVLLAGVFALDRVVESDGEQMIRKVQEITAAINARDLDRAFTHVSEHFERRPRNKSAFYSYARDRLQSRYVTEVQVWDFAVTAASRQERRGEVECFFKVRGSFGETPPGCFVRVTFMLDADGEWRVQDFDWYQSVTESRRPMPIPGW